MEGHPPPLVLSRAKVRGPSLRGGTSKKALRLRLSASIEFTILLCVAIPLVSRWCAALSAAVANRSVSFLSSVVILAGCVNLSSCVLWFGAFEGRLADERRGQGPAS